MKYNKTQIFLIGMLFVLIVLTISNTCVSFKPTYSKTKMGFAKYEGFGTREGLGGPLVGSSVSSPASVSSLLNSIKQLTPTANVSATPSSTKESFVGIMLSSSPYDTEKPLDKFSGTSGSISCDGGWFMSIRHAKKNFYKREVVMQLVEIFR